MEPWYEKWVVSEWLEVNQLWKKNKKPALH